VSTTTPSPSPSHTPTNSLPSPVGYTILPRRQQIVNREKVKS